jgi:hypothetical protein
MLEAYYDLEHAHKRSWDKIATDHFDTLLCFNIFYFALPEYAAVFYKYLIHPGHVYIKNKELILVMRTLIQNQYTLTRMTYLTGKEFGSE